MPITKLTPDYAFTEDRLEALKKVVPEAFADGKINWDVLQEALGEHLEDEKEEHFGLSWPGKREARRLAARPSRGTLAPCPGEGVNEDTTGNIFIEGENLEVMKILRKSYAGKIKMIYIDPPYNTGEDRIYVDDYSEPLEKYLRKLGAIGEQGELLTTNTKGEGRFHTPWLNMIFPRLKLAHELLAEDGVIFISIDDNEVHNLRQIMNEIFGENNFVTEFLWEKKKKPSFLDTNVGKIFDYIVCYTKNQSASFPFSVEKTTIGKKYPLNNAGNSLSVLKFPRNSVHFDMIDQVIEPQDMSSGNIITELVDAVTIEDGKNTNSFRLRGEFRYSQETLSNIIDQEEEITISKVPFRPNHVKKGGEIKKMHNALTRAHYNIATNEDASDELEKLFGIRIFSNPKPVGLIKHLIKAVTYNDKNALILDFFAGSATTAAAVYEQNCQDNGKRNFICVQIPEDLIGNDTETKNAINYCETNDLPLTLSAISKERMRREVQRIQKTYDHCSSDEKDFISGFKVYRLTQSNFKQWNEVVEEDIDYTLGLFDDSANSLIANWKPHILITEILLNEGFPLTNEIILLDEINYNSIYQIKALNFCSHYLFICLDEKISDKVFNLLGLREEDIFICLDSALSDELKVRLEDQFNIHVI